MKFLSARRRAIMWVGVACLGLLYVVVQVRSRGWDPLLILILCAALTLAVLSGRYLVRTDRNRKQ